MKNTIKISLILCFAFTSAACWESPDEGTVSIKTKYGNIERVIKPSDGAPYHDMSPGDDYHILNLRAFTQDYPVPAQTKDNAPLTVNIAVTASVLSDEASILAYVRKFGITEEDRLDRRGKIISGQVQTETKNAVAEFDAYSLLRNQEAVQKQLQERLAPIFKNQLYLNLESVQILGRPDFTDDRIDNAASGVVAANKKVDEEIALRLAAEEAKKRKLIEAETNAISVQDPKLYQLEQQRIQLDMEKARAEGIARHQGNLTLIYGGESGGSRSMQIQVPAGNR